MELREESQPADSTNRQEEGEKPLFEGEIVKGSEGTSSKVVRSRGQSRDHRPDSQPVNIEVEGSQLPSTTCFPRIDDPDKTTCFNEED